MLDTVILIILLISSMVMAHRIGELRPPKVYPPQYELTPAKQHRLVRTWIEPDPGDGGWPGWRWLCTCGTQGMGTTISQTSLGNEANTVKQFTNHAALFASVNEDGWKHKYEQKAAELDAYVQACYCKDTNDDLIHYRGK